MAVVDLVEVAAGVKCEVIRTLGPDGFTNNVRFGTWSVSSTSVIDLYSLSSNSVLNLTHRLMRVKVTTDNFYPLDAALLQAYPLPLGRTRYI